MARSIRPGTEPPAAGSSRRRWVVHLAILSAYILGVGALGARRARSGAPLLSHGLGNLLEVVAFEWVIFGVCLGLAMVASRASRDDLLLRWRGRFWPIPLGIGYSIAIRVALAGVLIGASVFLFATGLLTPDALRRFARDHPPNLGVLVDLPAMQRDAVYYWTMVTVVSYLVAGLREELWRSAFLAGMAGVWPGAFGSRAGRIRAVAVAAALFGFAHAAMGPMAVCFAAWIGLGLGLVMVLHRSIWPAVIAHGTFDATSMALIPWLLHLRPELLAR